MNTEHMEAAFPDQYKDGMTLRDYFAAKALQGILSGDEDALRRISSETCRKGIDIAAEISFQFADAMLKERMT